LLVAAPALLGDTANAEAATSAAALIVDAAIRMRFIDPNPPIS
jgi:hypothetical protein